MTVPGAEGNARFHAACGGMVRAWAGLEAAFVAHLRIFLDTDAFRARTVWRALPTVSARLGLLRTLGAAYLDEQRQRQLAGMLDRAGVLSAHRDLIVEAAGGSDLRTGRILLAGGIEQSGGSDSEIPGHRELTIDDIEGWAGEIAALEISAVKWLRTLSTTLRGSPRPRH